MYKNTRHTKKMWTYRSESVFSPWYGTEDEGRKIVEHSKAIAFDLRLLRPEEYIFDHLPYSGSFTFGKLVNDRIRRGTTFLRKRDFPETLIKALPNYFVITPKLGKALSRLERCSLHQVPTELHDLFQYLKKNGAPQNPKARPTFSSTAVRVRASDIPSPPAKPALSQLEILRLSTNRNKKKNKAKPPVHDLTPVISETKPTVQEPQPALSSTIAKPVPNATKPTPAKSARPGSVTVPLPKRITTALQTTQEETSLLEAFKRALIR